MIHDETSNVLYVAPSAFLHISQGRIESLIWATIYLYVALIALPPILNPRQPSRAVPLTLLLDIFSGVTAVLICALLACFSVNLFAVGLLSVEEVYIYGLAVSGLVSGLCVRFGLNYAVRPILKLALENQEQVILEMKHAQLLERVNNKSIRAKIASLQGQLYVADLNGEPGAEVTESGRGLSEAAS